MRRHCTSEAALLSSFNRGANLGRAISTICWQALGPFFRQACESKRAQRLCRTEFLSRPDIGRRKAMRRCNRRCGGHIANRANRTLHIKFVQRPNRTEAQTNNRFTHTHTHTKPGQIIMENRQRETTRRAGPHLTRMSFGQNKTSTSGDCTQRNLHNDAAAAAAVDRIMWSDFFSFVRLPVCGVIQTIVAFIMCTMHRECTAPVHVRHTIVGKPLTRRNIGVDINAHRWQSKCRFIG